MSDTNEIGKVWTRTRFTQNRVLLLLGLIFIPALAFLFHSTDTETQLGITSILIAGLYAIVVYAVYLGTFNMASLSAEFLHRTFKREPKEKVLRVSSKVLFVVFLSLPIAYFLSMLSLY